MYAAQLREAVRAAPVEKLGDVMSSAYRAMGAGQVSEAEVADLEAQVHLRRTAPRRRPAGKGSRPRSPESLERRRRLAAAGCLPPGVAQRFTQAETAVLVVIVLEVERGGDCRLPILQIAALAGVGRTVVKSALRQARALGLISIEERRIAKNRNDPNIVRIASGEWLAWIALQAPARARAVRGLVFTGGGVRAESGTFRKDSPVENGDVRRGASSWRGRRFRPS
ncbi:transcriptional regulator [Methylobacterium ajmalii]|uniref:transcriptional regulator n=1 Tax=Methylobacterium ajmalii TaxID=2738439 RepID=UPI002F35A456